SASRRGGRLSRQRPSFRSAKPRLKVAYPRVALPTGALRTALRANGSARRYALAPISAKATSFSVRPSLLFSMSLSRSARGAWKLGELGRRRVQVRVQDRDLRRTVERWSPGEALVEDAGERVDVGAAVHAAPLDLLRRAVLDRADEAPGSRRPVGGELLHD